MKLKKLTLCVITLIISAGLLFGCGAVQDEQEQDKPFENPQRNDWGGKGNQ
ncbi:hypothetical protein MKY30_15660 [Oceanobacillus sp. FSL W8-0428]|uniref:Lipoprotein n=1 Tax=Oceanobacillus sojae TaxID=582851 RepID=A0A511ZEI8_9BACI|nr:hypothetical protein [Oceanobacillus sojae]GEN85856.1 hypothetical protein OSO01_05950 [Oceanobacillus sojae]